MLTLLVSSVQCDLLAQTTEQKYVRSLVDSVRHLSFKKPKRAMKHAVEVEQIAQQIQWDSMGLFSLEKQYVITGLLLKEDTLASEILSRFDRLLEKSKANLPSNVVRAFQHQRKINHANYLHSMGKELAALGSVQSVFVELDSNFQTYNDTANYKQACAVLQEIYKARGDLTQAIFYLNKGMKVQETIYDQLKLGDLLFDNRAYEKAERYYLNAYQQPKTKSNTFFLTMAVSGLTQTYLEREAFTEALELVQDVKSYLLKRNQQPFNISLLAGQIHLAKGAYGSAMRETQQGLQWVKGRYKSDRPHYQYARFTKLLGDIAFARGDEDGALLYYELTLQHLIPDFVDKTPSLAQIDHEKEVLEVLSQKLQVLRHLESGQIQISIDFVETLSLSTALLDQIRRGYIADRDKQFLLDQTYAVYAAGIGYYEERQAITEAFDLYQSSRAVVLTENVLTRRAELHPNVDQELVADIRRVRKEAMQILSALERTTDTQEKESFRGQLAELKMQQKQLRMQLERQSAWPGITHSSEHLSVADIKSQLLEPNQGLLQYFAADSTLYAFLIHPLINEVQLFALPYSEQLQQDIQAYNQQLMEKKPFREDAYALYQQLIAPIFAEQSLPEKLVLMADGDLDYLPFQTLLTRPAATDASTRQLAFLCHETAVTENFSLELMASRHRQQASASIIHQDAFLVYAPEYDATLGPGLDRDQSNASLPGAQREANYLQEHYGATIYRNPDATMEHFVDHCPSAELIVFTGHAKDEREKPDASHLRFLDNQMLTQAQIYQLNLSAKLVILSACQTGTGEFMRGEGLLSLARSFAYAGANSVLSTLWEVKDGQTQKFMTFLMPELAKGHPIDESFQAAQRAYLSSPDIELDDLHPYYWAAFQITGSNDPIKLDKVLPWWQSKFLLLGVLGLLGFLGFFWWRS